MAIKFVAVKRCELVADSRDLGSSMCFSIEAALSMSNHRCIHRQPFRLNRQRCRADSEYSSLSGHRLDHGSCQRHIPTTRLIHIHTDLHIVSIIPILIRPSPYP